MIRRQLHCPGCGDSWVSPPARFCGRCGGPLDRGASGTTSRSASHEADRRGPLASLHPRGARGIALLVTAAVIAIAVATATFRGIEFEPPFAPDGSVALPDELGAPGRLSDEQREALAGFDPDRLRCDPAGCEAWRVSFDNEPTRLTVDNGWLAAIDGTVLRLRHLSQDVEVSRAERSAATDAPTRGTTTGEVVRTELLAATNEPTGGSSWGPAPEPDNGERDRDHDLVERFTALPWHDDPDSSGYLDVAATPPEQLSVLPDGGVVLRWYDRLALLSHDGDLRWEQTSNRRTFRYIDVVDDLLLVLRDDLPWPQGTTGPRPTGDPILASVHDLHDGTERWQRYTLSPRDVMAGGLLITTVDGGLEMVDLHAGITRWRRPFEGNERIQSTTGPWVVVTGATQATLIDARTGSEAAVREGAALLTPLQRIGELWVAAWLDGSLADGAARAAVVALDEAGTERWQTSIAGLGRGACCPAAIPWVEGTIAVHDPASPVARWRTLDLSTGTPVDLPDALLPRLPLSSDDMTRVFASSVALDRLVQEQEDRVGLLSAEGHARIQGGSDLEVVALDPFVVRQGRELLGVRPVPPEPPR